MGNYDAEVRISTKVDTSQMQKLQVQVDKSINKVEALTEKYEKLKNKKIPTDDFLEVQKQADETQAKLDKLLAKRESFHGSRKSASWLNMNAEIEELQRYLPYVQGELQDLIDTGKAFTLGKDSDEFEKLSKDLRIAKAELGALVTKQEEMHGKNRKIIGGFKGISDMAKKAFFGANKSVEKTNGLFSTFASRLKGITLSLLVFNWISKGFNGMIAGMKEGSKNLLKYSAEYLESMSDLKSANTQLKNSFATAFAPIMQSAIPYLVTLMNFVTSAMNKVAQFVAVLSGKSSWIKAIAVQEDYADSLNGTAAAAKKAMGALASFDTLEVLNKNESVSGGGGGVNPDDMFEEVPIEDMGVANFAKRLKELILSDDWYGLGAALGEKMNDTLDSIKWDKIKDSAKSIAYKIASLINGYVETPGLFSNIGRTIAEALNTAFDFLYTFATELHWDSIGLAISSGINGFFNTFDFKKAAETLNSWVDGIKTMIKTALSNTEWGDVWEGAKTFFSNLELDTVSILVGALIWKMGGAALTKELVKTGLANAAGWAVSSGALTWTVELGIVVIGSVLIFEFIKEPAIDLFSDGNAQLADDVKKRYDGIGGTIRMLGDGAKIAEGKLKDLPITLRDGSFAAGTMAAALDEIAKGTIYTEEQLHKMQESVGLTGEDMETLRQEMLMANPELMEIADTFGLFDASIETLEDIAGGMDALQRSAGNTSQTFELMHHPMNQMTDEAKAFFLEVENGNISVDDYITNMSDAAAGTEVFKSGFSEKWDGVRDWFAENVIPWFTGEKWEEISQGIIEGVDAKWQEFCAWWSETAIFGWWEENVVPWFSMEKWVELAQGIMDGISEKWGEVTSWWESAIGEWWESSVAPWFTAEKWIELGNNMKKGIYNGFLGIVGKVVDIVNAIITACENMINFMIDKINSLIESCAELANSIPGVSLSTSVIPNVAFGRVKMPQIPALAEGAVIRGGNPFMAILGDQRMGQTNIEAPQSAIEDAVLAGMNRAGMLNGGNMTININYDGETFARLAVKDFLSEMDRQGYDIDILGGLT